MVWTFQLNYLPIEIIVIRSLILQNSESRNILIDDDLKKYHVCTHIIYIIFIYTYTIINIASHDKRAN